MMLILLDPGIFRTSFSVKDNEETVERLFYLRPFNQAQVHYVLGLLLEVFQYGGVHLMRNLHNLSVENTGIWNLVKLVRVSKQETISYLDIILDTIIL